MRELDPFIRVVEGREQSRLDQAIAQRDQHRVVADVGRTAATLRDAAPAVLDASEMTEEPRQSLKLVPRQCAFDLFSVVAQN
jgi:hypothetical protein